MKKVFSALWLLGIVATIALITSESLRDGAPARAKAAELEAELAGVAPPTAAARADHRAGSKPRQAHAEDTFRCPLSYAELRAHYDATLAAQGWTLAEERPVRIWGRDYGGKIARYRKADYEASLEYAGARLPHGWDYALSLHWHLPGSFL